MTPAQSGRESKFSSNSPERKQTILNYSFKNRLFGRILSFFFPGSLSAFMLKSITKVLKTHPLIESDCLFEHQPSLIKASA